MMKTFNSKRNHILKIVSFVLIISIMMSSFIIVYAADPSYWVGEVKYGDIEIKYGAEETHPIPKVVSYLKNKYKNILNINDFEAPLPCINVHLFYKDEDIANAHIILYRCPKCEGVHYLVYMKPINRVIYDTKCYDNDDLDGKAKHAFKEIEEYFKSQVKANGGSWWDQLMLVMVLIAVSAVIVATLVALTILSLPALAL